MKFDRFTLTALVAAVAAGALLGGVGVHGRMTAAVDEARTAQQTAERAAAQAAQERERTEEALARLEERIDVAARESAALRERLFDAERHASLAETARTEAAETVSMDEFLDEFQDAFVDEDPDGMTADADDGTEGSEREGRRGRRGWGEAWADPERRAEMMERMHQRIAERSSDPDIQYRLDTLSSYAENVFDLRAQLRDAPDDATRALLQEELRLTMNEARHFIEGEQAYSLQTIAQRYGVNDPEALDAFVQDMRGTMQSPVFWPMPHVTGRGNFGGEGRRGGGRGGSWGGGPPGQ